MNWIWLTALSALCIALTRTLQRVLLRDEKSDSFGFALFFQLVVAGLFLLYTLVTKSFELPNLQGLGFNLGLMAVLYCLGSIFSYQAYKKITASEASVIQTSSIIWSVISAIIILNEVFKPITAVGVTLIITGIIVINYSRSGWKWSKGHAYAAISSLLYGLAFTNDVFIVGRYQSVASYMILAFALPGLGVAVIKPASLKQLKHFVEPKMLLKIILCGIFYALSAITIFMAYKSGGQASVIAPLKQTSIILTVIIGYLFLNERGNLIKYLAGAGVTFLGALLLI